MNSKIRKMVEVTLKAQSSVSFPASESGNDLPIGSWVVMTKSKENKVYWFNICEVQDVL